MSTHYNAHCPFWCVTNMRVIWHVRILCPFWCVRNRYFDPSTVPFLTYRLTCIRNRYFNASRYPDLFCVCPYVQLQLEWPYILWNRLTWAPKCWIQPVKLCLVYEDWEEVSKVDSNLSKLPQTQHDKRNKELWGIRKYSPIIVMYENRLLLPHQNTTSNAWRLGGPPDVSKYNPFSYCDASESHPMRPITFLKTNLTNNRVTSDAPLN